MMKTITEKEQRKIPPQKKINPGPGLEKDPKPIWGLFITRISPKQNQKRLVILSQRAIFVLQHSEN
jgi:hypothetical protein